MTITKLILIRGLPGSGKSTLAQQIAGAFAVSSWESVDENPCVHFEADMFHINDTGEYVWKPENVQKAHEWCQRETKNALVNGYDVIVSNTFTRNWEMLPYLLMAKELGAEVTVLTCEGNYGNVHGVPED